MKAMGLPISFGPILKFTNKVQKEKHKKKKRRSRNRKKGTGADTPKAFESTAENPYAHLAYSEEDVKWYAEYSRWENATRHLTNEELQRYDFHFDSERDAALVAKNAEEFFSSE